MSTKWMEQLLTFLTYEKTAYASIYIIFSIFSKGIVYAHRNEDIVNMGPGLLGNNCITSTKEDFAETTLPKTLASNSKRIHRVDLSTEQLKRNEFRHIAHYMGMDCLEFSKWILSASPSKRLEVLQNFNKKKKRRQLD